MGLPLWYDILFGHLGVCQNRGTPKTELSFLVSLTQIARTYFPRRTAHDEDVASDSGEEGNLLGDEEELLKPRTTTRTFLEESGQVSEAGVRPR